MRTTLNALLKEIPPDNVTAAMRALLEPWLSDRVFNIIHLIYQTKPFEEQYKAHRRSRRARCRALAGGSHGYCPRRTLAHPEFFRPAVARRRRR